MERYDDHHHDTEVPLARKVGRMGMLVHRYYEAQSMRHGGMGDPLRGQGRVLALLSAKPETTQRELSYLLDMRQQSLSELLAKLEDKGFITREKSAEDGRVTVVRLTQAGAEAVPSPEQMDERADALDCLSAEEHTQLEALTDKITASLEEKLEDEEPVTSMMDKGMTPEDILAYYLGDLNLVITERVPARFYCDCSKEKVSRALATISTQDLKEIINDGEEIEVKCYFCNSAYKFDLPELEEIMAGR